VAADLDEAMQRQLGHWRTALGSGAQRIGWKIGLNVPAVQERLGIDRSVVGHLTSATLLRSGGTHSLTGADKPFVEPEITIEVDGEGGIVGLGAAIEIVDFDRPIENAAEVVSDNIFHRAVVIGPSTERRDADGVQARLIIDGEVREQGDAGATDLAGVVALVDATLRTAGERLEVGERIIAGSLTAPVAVSPGQRVELDLGPLGAAEIELAG
jgi:2-keto-4-pentenoate hydratase